MTGNEFKHYVVKGMFQMVVEAEGWVEARQTAERIMRNDGIKCMAIEATEVGGAEGTKGAQWGCQQ